MTPLAVRGWAVAGALLLASLARVPLRTAAVSGPPDPPRPPQRLTGTGLYRPGSLEIDPRNQPYAPQYPLWSDGAAKRRWVHLPPGSAVDVTNADAWDFPVGTRFWKEFAFSGRKIETRLLWKAPGGAWVFASYAWNEAQTDAELVPADGLPDVVEIAPKRWHSIPSTADCRTCHDSARTEILGFNALQLSDERDPNALHAEAVTADMVTLRTLVESKQVRPVRAEWIAAPPRIEAADPQTRAALGYLSTNCGNCHNAAGSLASLGLSLRYSTGSGSACPPALMTTIGNPGRWVIPSAPAGASQRIHPGDPEHSAVLHRMRSRRPSSQMPPLGSVMTDAEAVELLTAWIRAMDREAPECR